MTSERTKPTALDVLRAARRVVEDGGDPNPCEMGAYCLRCCIGIAKGMVDDRFDTPTAAGASFIDNPTGHRPLKLYETDRILIEARDLIARFDKGVTHTRGSALALLDRAMTEAKA